MNYKSEIIFVKLLVPFSAGILLAYFYPSLLLQDGLGWMVLLVFSCLIFLNMGYLKFRAYQMKGLTILLFYFLIFCLGGWCCLHNIQNIQPGYFDRHKPEILKVVVDEEPQLKGKLLRFKAKVVYGFKAGKGFPYKGRLLLALKSDNKKPMMLEYGDMLLIPAKYTPVEPPQNIGEFDFSAWLAMQNIYQQVYLNQQPILLSHNCGNTVIAFALTFRQRQIDQLKKLIHGQEAFSVASTLLLGYRADLNKETLNSYAKTGTIHALSVSGMHVGLIYIILNWLLRFLNHKKGLKIIKLFLIITLIWFYALITGFSPSVLRSAIMLTAFILAKTLNRSSNSYNILAFSAFTLLVYNSLLIFDVGFQLSFLSVFGLIYLQPLIYHGIYFKFKWADKLWNITAMSLAAQIATFPLSVYYFHQFPVYFLFSNLFIMLPAALMMYIGLGMLLCRLYFLAPVLEEVLNFTNAGLKWIAHLPFSTISSIWLDKFEFMLLSTTLILGVLSMSMLHKKLLYVSLFTLLTLQIAMGIDKLKAHQQKKMITFKLKKNYAKAYLLSKRAFLFTDVNPESKLFLFSIKPCLDQHGITEIQFRNSP